MRALAAALTLNVLQLREPVLGISERLLGFLYRALALLAFPARVFFFFTRLRVSRFLTFLCDLHQPSLFRGWTGRSRLRLCFFACLRLNDARLDASQ